jgi:hypothetical protein
MKILMSKLQDNYPELKFKTGKQFSWDPETNMIGYTASIENEVGIWSILHEAGHALLGHKSYKADFELLKLEVEAWEKAKALALEFQVNIDEEHIQDCLDTYRDWLYSRSICPKCTAKCLQQNNFVHYRCFNCHTTWKVSSNRFCRIYRRTKDVPQISLAHFSSSLT